MSRDFLISSIYDLFHKDEAEISALYEEAANAAMCPCGVNKSGRRGKGIFECMHAYGKIFHKLVCHRNVEISSNMCVCYDGFMHACELAHLVVKKHTSKFWEIVKQIYPQYEKGKKELSKRFNHV